MTRMHTRSSTRQSQIPRNNYAFNEEISKESFSRMRNTKRNDQSDESDIDETVHLTPKKEKTQRLSYKFDEASSGTPPKQKKFDKDEQEVGIKTPSNFLRDLNLSSPPPKSVENIKLGRSNRKNLFGESKYGENILEDEQQNGRKSKKINSVYQYARQSLHTHFPTDMPGRENELDDLKEFIKCHLTNETSGSLYISGPPGTGKTASLNKILEDEDISSQLRKVYVNCTSIKSPTAIYSRITDELDIKVNGKTEKDYLARLERYLKKHKQMILLVLDEIDQLESKNQSILYTIFEWPSKPNSRLILVGIANALDLTDRILPRLQARCELKPKLMHFSPYTKPQIVEILSSRLKAAGVLEVFSPVALQMLAGKVAAVSGDVRRALDIGRRVVELVDQNKSEDILKSSENLVSNLLEKELKGDNVPKTVDLKHVVNVLNNVYGTSQNLTEDTEDTFPLQQKIVICSLILMLKKAKNKDVTVGKLHEVYKRVCSKRNLLAVDQAEFVGLCSLIETRGILRVTGRKEPRLHKVSLEWDEEEVASALKDKQLMSMILQDDSCLGKL